MNSNSHHFIHQTTKAALITTVALALLLPNGIAAADSSVTSVSAPVSVKAAKEASTTTSTVTAPDPSKAKITEDEAVAKIRQLFPALKEATVSGVQLGNNNSYPPSPNQMIWDIQWQYQTGNSSFGFSSQVDAMTGDLINIYVVSPLAAEDVYYPPKLSEAEALQIARSFITKAAPSLGSNDIKQTDQPVYNMNESVLFGPVQYNFSFNVLKNGLPSALDILMVTVDGNGNVTRFNKPVTELEYPSAKPAVSLEQAQKTFTDEFDIRLYYIPVVNGIKVEKWILGWRAQDEAVYSINAQTGKRIDDEGSEVSSTPVAYESFQPGKTLFQPLSSGKELTAVEAAKLVQQSAYIPEGRKLVRQQLSPSYMNTEQKTWKLYWEAPRSSASHGIPPQSYAEIDALTGEIIQYQTEQYFGPEADAAKPAPAPSGAKKLNSSEAKQKAIELINKLYNHASSDLKLVEHGGTWSVLPDGKGFRFQFQRYHQDLPVSGATVSMNLDMYGRIQNYYSSEQPGFEAIKEKPVPAVSKEDALKKYLGYYTLALQYKRTGGYMSSSVYIDPKVKLVYDARLLDPQKPYEVLDAATGKWISIYKSMEQSSSLENAVDVKGHSAEKQLTELLTHRVLVPDADGKVNPDQEISVGDWISLLVKASNPYYASYSAMSERKTVAGVNPENPYYDFISYAVEREWIKRDVVLQPENKLSREQLAVLLASFLNYSKISGYLENDATVTSFSDSTTIKNKGAVALAVKLGLLEADNGKFNPQQNVTKAQAAIVIMKLVELQGKTDRNLGQYRY